MNTSKKKIECSNSQEEQSTEVDVPAIDHELKRLAGILFEMWSDDQKNSKRRKR